jgi:hypothetical protein
MLSGWLGSYPALAQTSTLRLGLPVSIESSVGRNIASSHKIRTTVNSSAPQRFRPVSE